MSQVQITTVLQDVIELCPTCPMPTVVSAYIRAVRRFCNQSRWYKTMLVGATVAPVAGVGTPTYNLGSDTYNEVCGIAAVSIRESATDGEPLTQGNPGEWDPDDTFDLPTKYAYIPHGQLTLHPTPDQVYTLNIGLVLQPKLNSNSIDDALLVNWSEIFKYGALSHIQKLKGHAWSDSREAEVNMSRFNAGINSAASDVAAGYNAGATSTGALGPRAATVRTRMQVL